MSKDPRSNWDAPADGDFASYVERLNAAHASGSASAPTPPPAISPATASAAAPAIDPEELTPEEAASTAGLTAKVRSVRLVFLLVLVGQVLLLIFFKKGSLALLFFTGIIWVMLGKAQSTLFSAFSAAGGRDAAKNANLQRLREQFQRTARERKTKQKK